MYELRTILVKSQTSASDMLCWHNRLTERGGGTQSIELTKSNSLYKNNAGVFNQRYSLKSHWEHKTRKHSLIPLQNILTEDAWVGCQSLYFLNFHRWFFCVSLASAATRFSDYSLPFSLCDILRKNRPYWCKLSCLWISSWKRSWVA